jgi:hypothetical protein
MSDNIPRAKENEIIRRVKREYTNIELENIEDDKTILLAEIRKLERTPSSRIYENQIACAKLIVAKFENRKIIAQLIYALTQSGKTGAMCAIIKYYMNDDNPIPVAHIYVLTGLNSIEWEEQTKKRLPKSIEDRVYHRARLLKSFINDIKGKQNCLIIMDEIQIAAKEKQTLYKMFQDAGFNSKQSLLKNDIKIVEFSATPDGIILI